MKSRLLIIALLASLSAFGQFWEDTKDLKVSDFYGIDYVTDDFTEERKFYTTTDDIQIVKIFSNKKEENYLSLKCFGQTAIAIERGAILLFTDKSRIEMN